MTLEEVDKAYSDANWLIAQRSVVTAGKALLFSGSDLAALTGEIAALYGLTDEERRSLEPANAHQALTGVQTSAAGLFGGGAALTAQHALAMAKAAIDQGHVAKMAAALVRGGPRAAQAAATGGAAVGKATAWGWLATAVYALGSAGWLAYHAHSFNAEAYKLVAA